MTDEIATEEKPKLNGHSKIEKPKLNGHSKIEKSDDAHHPHRVPFSSIEIDPDFNVRTQYDSKEIADLASSIDSIGLMTPLTITEGGTKGKPYRLVSGFCRSLALQSLKWGSKDVKVVFVEKKSGSSLFLSNLGENTARQDVHPFDQAKRYSELEAGLEYDGEIVKLSRKEIALATSLSQASIGNSIRAYRALSEDSKRAWRKHDVPMSVVLKLAMLNEEEQETLLGEHLTAMEAEKAEGRKRRKKQEESDEEGEDGTRKTTKKMLLEVSEMLHGLLEENPKGAEKAYVEGKIQGIRFALSEIGRRGMATSYNK